MVAASALLLYAGRHLTFFYDDWEFILNRRWAGVSTWLLPHNSHPTVFPVAVYKLLFAIVGLRHYTPYRVAELALHLLSAGMLYVLCRRRLGPWLALVPTTLLLFMGTAWQDLLWPASMGFLTSVAGGLAALTLLDCPTQKREVVASAMLVWSLSGSLAGLAFLFAAAALLAGQQRLIARWWVVAGPTGLFALWYLTWESGQHVGSDQLLAAPQYIANAAADAVAGITGLVTSWGPPLLVIAVVGLALAWRRRRGATVTPMLIAAGVGALAFWGLVALGREGIADPGESRYLYVGAVFIMLIAAETGAGASPTTGWLAVGGVLLAGALISNLGMLRTGDRSLRGSSDAVRTALAVIDVAVPAVAPDFEPDPVNAPGITAFRYLLARRSLGSPALTIPELARAAESIRLTGDRELEHAEALALAPTTAHIVGIRPITINDVAGGRTLPGGHCVSLLPAATGATLDITVPNGTKLLLATRAGTSGTLSLRRFASTFTTPLASLVGGATEALTLPLDSVPVLPWHARITATRPTELCLR